MTFIRAGCGPAPRQGKGARDTAGSGWEEARWSRTLIDLERRAEELIKELSAEAERIEYTPVPAGAYFSNSGEPTEPDPQGPTQESDRFRRTAQVIEQLLSENRQV